MRKIESLLYEVVKNKRAVLFAGPAGSGKTTIIKNYIPSKFQEYVINADKYYEADMKKLTGDSEIKQSEFTPELLSKSAKVMSKAQKQVKLDFEEAILRGRPIIMDITGGSSAETVRKKHKLEDAGYSVMMVMIYVSPISVLERNAARNRTLKPSIVLRSWKDVVSNIQHYRKAFKDNFVLIKNEKDEEKKLFSADNIERFFETSPNFKKLSPEEKTTLELEINKIANNANDQEFTPFDELDSKLKAFLKVK